MNGWPKDAESAIRATAEVLKRIPKNSYEMVKEFHLKFGHPVADEITMLDKDFEYMRLELIREELVELYEACGYDAHQLEEATVLWTGETTDPVAVADALGDLEYVVNGMALNMGINLPDVVEEIHRSNMTKLGEDGKPIYREDGKILKGPGYEPPRLEEVLGV